VQHASQPAFAESDIRQPALFIGHGSPLNAIEDNPFSRTWKAEGQALPRPQAILCISAHWETIGTQVTASPQPRTIHDFYGFPPALYQLAYPAPGVPDLARRVAEMLAGEGMACGIDPARGLDHGAWVPLILAWPEHDIPVLQLSEQSPPGPAYNL